MMHYSQLETDLKKNEYILDPIIEAPMSILPSVTRLYLINEDSYKVKIPDSISIVATKKI